MTTAALLLLAFTSFSAATVNGALGYGYSSITVPVALLVTVGRVLNPALVIVEVAINLYALFWNRRAARAIVRRVLPLLAGVIPGVIAGALLLGHIAPARVKLAAYALLLPLILLQASGRRWPLRNEKTAAVPFGGAVGVLYGFTTISGPPLALFWNNQGLDRQQLKIAIALVRAVESMLALAAYAYFGILTRDSASLLPWIVPGVLVGFPLGHALIQRVSVMTFRRVCISCDAYLVAFGLARTLSELGMLPAVAYSAMIVTAIIDAPMLWSFLRRPVVAPEGAT